MFLSLVRPDRISSPITSSAAVTTSLGTGTVVMITCGRTDYGGRMTDDGCQRRDSSSSVVWIRPTLPLWVMLLQVARRAVPLPGRRISLPIGPGTGARTGRRAGGEPMSGPAPRRPIAYAPPRIVVEKAPDGGLRCRSREPLAPYDPSLARLFRAAVERNPASLFLAERDVTGGWRKLNYGSARPLVDALAQGLIERGLSAERPVMILSGNDIEHALLTLACHTAGVPVAPISVAYSLQSKDHAKLKHIAALLEPGLVYVADTAPFAKS